MHTPVNIRLHKTHLGKGNRFCWLCCCQCAKKVFLLQLLYKHTSCTTPSVCFQLFIHLFTSARRSRALSLLCRKSLLLYSVFVNSVRRQKRWESGRQWNSWDEQMSNCNATNHEGFFLAAVKCEDAQKMSQKKTSPTAVPNMSHPIKQH